MRFFPGPEVRGLIKKMLLTKGVSYIDNNDGKTHRNTNNSSNKQSIFHSFHSNLDKIAGDFTKSLDDFFLGEENIQNRHNISTARTTPRKPNHGTEAN